MYIHNYIHTHNHTYYIYMLRKQADRHGLVVGCKCSEFIGGLGAVAGIGWQWRRITRWKYNWFKGKMGGGRERPFPGHVPSGNLVSERLRFPPGLQLWGASWAAAVTWPTWPEKEGRNKYVRDRETGLREHRLRRFGIMVFAETPLRPKRRSKMVQVNLRTVGRFLRLFEMLAMLIQKERE